MPFDGTGFEAGPATPKRPARRHGAAAFIIVALAFCLLVMPISLGVLVDIARHLQGR